MSAHEAEGRIEFDWADFPNSIDAAEGFKDPFEDDWNEWLERGEESQWEPATPLAIDDDAGDE